MCCCRVNLKFGFGPQIAEICVPQITAENSRKEHPLLLGRPMCPEKASSHRSAMQVIPLSFRDSGLMDRSRGLVPSLRDTVTI
jgi:hypothetical protein